MQGDVARTGTSNAPNGGDSAGGERGYAMAGFLAMAFAVVGLTGLLAANVAGLPLERVIARDAVLDTALAAADRGDAPALMALQARLGDSDAILPPGEGGVPAGFAATVAAERVAMRARRLADAQATAGRLNVLLVVVTAMAAGFGTVMVLAGQRVASRDRTG